MSSETYLFDTSALMTQLEDEAGTQYVNTLLLNESVMIPWVALLEMFYITLQERGEEVANQRYTLLLQLPAIMLWEMNEHILRTAAHFKAAYHISFADALIARFAATHNAILIHKDPEYEVLKDQVRLEALPYKKQAQLGT